MAAAADVRDMLDLPAESQPRPHKKQKVVEKRPGMCFLTSVSLYLTQSSHKQTHN